MHVQRTDETHALEGAVGDLRPRAFCPATLETWPPASWVPHPSNEGPITRIWTLLMRADRRNILPEYFANILLPLLCCHSSEEVEILEIQLLQDSPPCQAHIRVLKPPTSVASRFAAGAVALMEPLSLTRTHTHWLTHGDACIAKYWRNTSRGKCTLTLSQRPALAPSHAVTCSNRPAIPNSCEQESALPCPTQRNQHKKMSSWSCL